jgi:Mor family transcriptional regulator
MAKMVKEKAERNKRIYKMFLGGTKKVKISAIMHISEERVRQIINREQKRCISSKKNHANTSGEKMTAKSES